MNILLFCDKRQKRELETVIQKTDNCTLLGTEVILKSDVIEQIFDDYNPHGIIISHGMRNDSPFSEIEIAIRVKERRPSMRIIFLYGQIADNDDFQQYYNELSKSMIYDIITSQPFSEIFPQMIKNPFSKSDLDATLEEKAQEAKEQPAEQPQKNFNIMYDVIKRSNVNLSHEALLLREFDMLNVAEISENEPEYMDMECITVGVAGLQVHVGCTHTAFEIAQFLRKNDRKACVVMLDDECFNRLCDFYDVPQGSGGLIIQKINVFQKSGLEQALQNYNYVIIDFGVLTDTNKSQYASCGIKLMVSSAADWNLIYATDFINREKNIGTVFYCFFPVSRKKFIDINRQMIKSGNHAYRLSCSEEFYLPCQDNETVYLDIFKRYSLAVKKRKEALRGKRKW